MLISIKPGTIRGTPLSLAIPRSSTDNGITEPLPNILIGPGTGVAPMRGLIQHEVARQMYLKKLAAEGTSSDASTSVFACASAAAVAAVPHALLFFGCRKRERDFLYAADWEKLNNNMSPYTAGSTGDGDSFELQSGSVTVSVAFSQDQVVKDYVTHKIKAQGAFICQMLQKVSLIIMFCTFSRPKLKRNN